MRAKEFILENELIEAPLPSEWDTDQFKPGSTFKQRLAYALERAKKIGTGSSRVAMIIEYEGRPTVLKIAKNKKGLAQNEVEASVLDDRYANQLGILIPFIDADPQNNPPTWIHTELAQKATERQICRLIGCDDLNQLVNMAYAQMGIIPRWNPRKYKDYIDMFHKKGLTDEQIENIQDYANALVDLHMSFSMELDDFSRAANWGIYKGKPVIIDLGFDTNVKKTYYR